MFRLLLASLLLLSFSLEAQHTVRVERCHSFPEGEAIHCLHIEDDRIWLGTSQGLYFYSYKKNRRNIIEGMSFTAVARDSLGRLWAANDQGKVITSDRQKQLDISRQDFNPYVTQLEAKRDELWVSTAEQGIYVFDMETLKRKAHYTETNSKLPSNTVNFIQLDKRGDIWAGTTKGVCQISGEKIKVFEKSDNITAATNYENDVWFIGNRKLWKVDNENRWAQIRLDKRLSNGVVRDMGFDDEGRLYSASNIFSRYDIIEDTMSIYGKDYGFVSDQSLCVASDGNGDIWVGTREQGLFRFKLYFKDEVPTDELTAICYSEGDLKCSGDTDGALALKVNGGKAPYTYQWNYKECKGTNPKNLKAGKYIVTITDIEGSTAVASARINQPKGIGFSIKEVQHLSRASAKDGVLVIEGIGGTGNYSYEWENGSTEPSRKRLSKGSYSITITDGNGCRTKADFEIKGPRILPELMKTEDIKAGETIAIKELYFDADSTQFRNASVDVLNEVYDFLIANPNIRVEIGGHTNNLPADEYCDWLSNLRAKSVADYLYQKGIPQQQLSYKGYGKKNPIADNNSKSGRSKNQRVEIKVLDVK